MRMSSYQRIQKWQKILLGRQNKEGKGERKGELLKLAMKTRLDQRIRKRAHLERQSKGRKGKRKRGLPKLQMKRSSHQNKRSELLMNSIRGLGQPSSLT